MFYDFLIKDIELNKSQKILGTDKGLAKIGDSIVNLAYSMAKSIYLTKNSKNNKIVRTGWKVSKTVLANALKETGMKNFARSRANAHDIADTAEALVAYVWLKEKMTSCPITNQFCINNYGPCNDCPVLKESYLKNQQFSISSTK